LQPPAVRRWDVLSHCLSVCHLQVAAGTGGIVIGAGMLLDGSLFTSRGGGE